MCVYAKKKWPLKYKLGDEVSVHLPYTMADGLNAELMRSPRRGPRVIHSLRSVHPETVGLRVVRVLRIVEYGAEASF